MVGIPGKSLGCHNCRRRKIRCDLAKPHCERCTKTGRTCEGYTRETIFLNRTIAGSSQTIPVPPQIRQVPALRYQIEGIFLEQYLAKGCDSKWPSPGTYVCAAIRELPHDWTLEPAIQALCMTRVGRFRRDMQMLRQGHQAYGLALRRLCVAVSKPDSMLLVSTIAAAKILNLYEHYEPSDNSVKGLYDHVTGLTNLIALRGHSQHNTHAMRLLLETSRFNSMVNAIVGWQHSPLSRIHWRAVSWDTPADFEQRLYDVGYSLAGIMDDVHLFAMQGPALKINGATRTLLAGRWLAVRQDLSSWYNKLVAFAPSPMFYQATQDFEHSIYHGRSFQFSRLLLAHMLMDYWAIKLFCNMVLEALHASISEQDMTSLPEIRALNTAMENVSVLEQFDLARHIEASVNYCCQPSMGWVGPQRTLFPLRVALVLYRRTPGAVAQIKKRELRRMMRKLPERSGLFVANAMMKRWSQPWALAKHFEHIPGEEDNSSESVSSGGPRQGSNSGSLLQET